MSQKKKFAPEADTSGLVGGGLTITSWVGALVGSGREWLVVVGSGGGPNTWSSSISARWVYFVTVTCRTAVFGQITGKP